MYQKSHGTEVSGRTYPVGDVLRLMELEKRDINSKVNRKYDKQGIHITITSCRVYSSQAHRKLDLT